MADQLNPGPGSYDAWDDLPRAIELLSKHRYGDYPFHCEHDVLYVMSNPELYATEELEELDGLGFFPGDGGDRFISYRFGSA